MKFIFFLSSLIISNLVIAQVNLDKAYLGKTGNTLFYDLNDPNTIWAIPKFLEATTDDDIIKVGNEYRIRFHVGLPSRTLLDLTPQPGEQISFRAFRATEATLEQISDIDPILNPKILPLGDIGMFAENIPYNIVLQAKKHPNTAKRTARHIFDGKRAFLLGRISYFFSAIRSGQAYQAQSTVAILALKKQSNPIGKKVLLHSLIADINSTDLRNSSLNLFNSSTQGIDELYNPQILFNSQSECWNKSLENVICLKDN